MDTSDSSAFKVLNNGDTKGLDEGKYHVQGKEYEGSFCLEKQGACPESMEFMGVTQATSLIHDISGVLGLTPTSTFIDYLSKNGDF